MKMEKKKLYYPRKMRVGWCVAHEVTAAGVKIERYGVKCRTYAEAYRRAYEMNLQPEAAVDGSSAAGGTVGTDGTTVGRKISDGGGRA